MLLSWTIDRMRCDRGPLDNGYLYQRWTLRVLGVPVFRKYQLLAMPMSLATPSEGGV